MPEWATKTHLFQPLGFASVPPFHSCSNHFYTESKQWETSLFQNLNIQFQNMRILFLFYIEVLVTHYFTVSEGNWTS